MTSATQMNYETIDDYLGDGRTRFFSHGYRRVEYDVTGLVATPADQEQAGLSASVTVRYPSDWSKKTADVDLRPHLSSVDMIILGTQLAEAHLTHAYRLDADQRRNSWLRRVTLKAGTTPQEELDDMPAFARLLETAASGERHVSAYDCTIGVMKARVEIEHDVGARAADERRFATLDHALGGASTRYFGDGFKPRSQLVENVRVDLDELRAEATVLVHDGNDDALTDGVGGAYPSVATVVDGFVVNLQLAQVLMYELDSVSRSNSNTLWMLNTVLEADEPPRSIGEPLTAHTAITGKHLVPLQGRTWRNVELTGELAGIKLRCSFAHELPAETTVATA